MEIVAHPPPRILLAVVAIVLAANLHLLVGGAASNEAADGVTRAGKFAAQREQWRELIVDGMKQSITLNETFRMLNLGLAGSVKNQHGVSINETDDYEETLSAGRQVARAPARRRPAKPTKSATTTGTTATTDGSIKRLLVRQLTNLFMNSEPKAIVEQVKSRQGFSESKKRAFGGRRTALSPDDKSASTSGASETTLKTPLSMPLESGRHRRHQDGQMEDAYKERKLSTPPPPVVEVANNEVHLRENEERMMRALHHQTDELQADNLAAAAGGPDDQMAGVTCSSDYEDLAIIDAASGGNLTAEQQQQLLAGADSSGLLLSSPASALDQYANETGGGGGGGGLRPPVNSCVQQGNKMIEIITKVITPILFSIIIVVGLVGNIVVMLVILEDRKLERELTPTNLLILDLSLGDLSFIILCIPFTGWDYAVGHWVFGPLWCKFNQYLIVVCALSSIYTLVLMSIDRFMAIVYPIECISYRTSRNMLHAIFIKWIVILLIASPSIPMHGLIDSPLGPDQFNCRFLTDQYNPLHFQITFFITSYLFPLILIFCLYLSLLNKLWFGSKPHGHKESLKMLESKKKVTWLVAGIVVVFAACWCPIQIMLILMRLKSHRITATYVAIQVFAHTLGYMNSCINPIVYAFASETFHQSFKRSWLGRVCNCCFSASPPSAAYPTSHSHPLCVSTGGGGGGANGQNHTSGRLIGGLARTSAHNIGALTPRSSFTTPYTNNNNNNNRSARNQSLNHIFSAAASKDSESPIGQGSLKRGSLATMVPGGAKAARNGRQLVLEPRDRPTSQQMVTIGLPSCQSPLLPRNNNNSSNNGTAQQLSSPCGTPQNEMPSTEMAEVGQKPAPAANVTSATAINSDLQALTPRQPTAFATTTSGLTTTTTTNNRTPGGASNGTGRPQQPVKQQLVAQMVQSSNQISHRCEPCNQSEPTTP